jgi:D-cysteine desulfhydrase family pyridoxal phosphate-dependent enzyme
MLPRLNLAYLPTPVDALPRLSEILAGPELFIKRDDLTGLAFGGNKTRKLEYLLADARAENAELILTTGAAQSNHCRQTAAAAARSGLKCKLVLVGPAPDKRSGNLFLDELLGAEVIWTDRANRDQTLEGVFQDALEAGAKPYLIPYGGSNYLGAYAYYQAYQELRGQFADKLPDWIVFASSSGGTQAGLFAGSRQSGSPRVLGISVDEPAAKLQEIVQGIAASLGEQLDLDLDFSQDDILVNDSYTGQGYGIMNDLDRQAIQLFAETEGILLDPVYTGRAAAGMLDLIRQGFFKPGQKVLFWHTGGTPGLFADRYLEMI